MSVRARVPRFGAAPAWPRTSTIPSRWRFVIPSPIRIIGIDPGLRTTGWGVIEAIGTRLAFVACGVVRSAGGDPLAVRLRALHDGLADIVAAQMPDEAAVEETFVNRDPQAALKLGQARGIALLVPALAAVPVTEYSANLIKKTVTGAGLADKTQVQMMVKVLLPRCTFSSPDAADALAVAITHAQHRTAMRRTAEFAATNGAAR